MAMNRGGRGDIVPVDVYVSAFRVTIGVIVVAVSPIIVRGCLVPFPAVASPAIILPVPSGPGFPAPAGFRGPATGTGGLLGASPVSGLRILPVPCERGSFCELPWSPSSGSIGSEPGPMASFSTFPLRGGGRLLSIGLGHRSGCVHKVTAELLQALL